MPAATDRPSRTSLATVTISDDAVSSKTGRNWRQWFEVIDAPGGKRMMHKEIVAVVSGCGAPPWWQQMVTVSYEQSRGLRQKHQTADGYQVSATRTIGACAQDLFRDWSESRRRAKWLPGSAEMVIRKSTPAKSIRVTWTDGVTHVDVNLYPQGPGKCRVTIDHRKLPDAKAAARMKRHWSAALERLGASAGG